MVSDDRGQLILIGAVAIALILVGLVLVVNTALFTEVVGSEGTVETTKDGGVAAQELEDAVSALAHNRTVAGSVSTGGSPNVNATRLESALQNQSIDSSGAHVSVEYLRDEDYGRYVYQPSTNAFTGSPVTFVQGYDVGHFLLLFEDTSSGTMNITVEGRDGTTESLEIEENGSTYDLGGADARNCDSIEPASDGSVRMDVYHGAVHQQPSCTFDLFEEPEPPYTVRTPNGDSYDGEFYLVTNNSAPSLSGSYPAAVQSTDAIWSYRLAYESHTDEVSMSGEREVNVYD